MQSVKTTANSKEISVSNPAQKSPGSFFKPFIQAKLSINQPNDIFEQEADAMSERVMHKDGRQSEFNTTAKNSTPFFSPRVIPGQSVQRTCEPCEKNLLKNQEPTAETETLVQLKEKSFYDRSSHATVIQRKCSGCTKKEKLRRKSDSSGQSAPSFIETDLRNARGSGSPLPETTRREMEASFGADFSDVSIHTGHAAAQINSSIGAHAFTHGNDIYFNEGKYNTGTGSGKKLLAHELTHVIQQGGSNRLSRSLDGNQKQPLLRTGKPAIQGKWYNFSIPFTDYEFDPSISGIKTAAGLTYDAGKWAYRQGKYIVGNAYECAKATGRSAWKLATLDFDSLPDLLGMEKPAGGGPALIDWISFVVNHPCLKMIPGYRLVLYGGEKLVSAAKFLKGAWHMVNNPDEAIEAIRTSSLLNGMITGISPMAQSLALKSVTFSSPSAEILDGIYRHLSPKLTYLFNNWWEVLKSAGWDLIWPWPGVKTDLGIIWDELGNCVDNLWDLRISDAADNLLAVWRTVNSMLGRLYGWFLIASVLIGAIIGAFFGGAGAIPGALLGFEFAMAVGKGLLISTIAAETASIAKAGLDLVFSRQSLPEKENDYEQIANSGITLAITGIMAVLGALAIRFAKGLISKIAGIFKPLQKGATVSTGGAGKGGGTGGAGQGEPWWTQPSIKGGKGSSTGSTSGPVARGGGSTGDVVGNTALKIEPRPVIEVAPPAPKPKLKLVPQQPPAAAKTPAIPTKTGPVIGGLTGAETAKKLKEKQDEEDKKTICYGISIVLRIEGYTFVPITSSPTPNDLRIPACILRTATGITDDDFIFRNIAVGRFIVRGNPEYVAAPNPEGNIHSEDEVFRLAEQRFGAGNFTLDALFTERRPCARCTGNIFRFPRTPGFLVYCIINNDYNWRQIRNAYNDGRI